jgi:hypothetical protein
MRSGMRPLVHVAIVASTFAFARTGYALSNGIIAESTNVYHTCGAPMSQDLMNANSEVNQFVSGMTTTGGVSWSLWADWHDQDAWDRNFYDSDLVSGADDNVAFDPPGGAIAYYAGHGLCDDVPNSGTGVSYCTTSSACTGPAPHQSAPGVCTEGPNEAAGTCLYQTARKIGVCSPSDGFNGVVDYSDGNVRFGESSTSGSWAGAGTNGGINFAVLDISCGVRPGLEFQGMFNAFAGVHNIATVMPTTYDSDNADVADRGPAFAARFRAHPTGSISLAWIDTLNDATGGSSCNGTSSGNHGINGCGANWSASVAQSESEAEWLNGTESWAQAQNDSNDPTGAWWMAWIYVCNYDCGTYPITI